MAFDYRGVESFLERNMYSLILHAYVILFLAVLVSSIRPGLYVTDEGVYLLMADSLARDRSFSVWNGMEYPSVELEFIESVDLHGGRLYPQYPQLYALIALPFYILLGQYGLALINVLAFCGTMLLLYHTCRLMFSSEQLSLTAVAVYSALTYSTSFALDVWPHSLTTFLVAASVYAGLKAVRDGGAMLFFASGLLSAAAVGVRYQAVLYSGVLLLYVLLEAGRRPILFFAAGMLPPLILLSAINHASYGSLLSVGYSGMKPDFGGYLYFQVFAAGLMLIALPYVLHKAGYGGRAGRITLAALAASIFLLYAVDPQFTEHAYTAIRVLIAEVFDIGGFPVKSVIVPGAKRSVLQASPLLALAAAGAVLVKNRTKRGTFYLLVMLASVEILFFSGRVNQHGGQTNLMRYFLQSLPYLSILTAYALLRVYPDVKWGLSMVSWAIPFIAVVYLMLLASFGELPLFGFQEYQRALMLLLSAALLVLFTVVHCGAGWVRPAFTAVVLFSASYSFLVNTVEVVNGMNVRAATHDLVGELDYVRDNSTVVYYGVLHLNYLAQLKTVKHVRIANAGRDNASTTLDLADYYLGEGAPVYVIAEMLENEYILGSGFNNRFWLQYTNNTIAERYDTEEIETKTLRVLRLKGVK